MTSAYEYGKTAALEKVGLSLPMSSILKTVGRHALTGAGVGAATGGISGAVAAPEGQGVSGFMRGAGAGAALGGLAGAASGGVGAMRMRGVPNATLPGRAAAPAPGQQLSLPGMAPPAPAGKSINLHDTYTGASKWYNPLGGEARQARQTMSGIAGRGTSATSPFQQFAGINRQTGLATGIGAGAAGAAGGVAAAPEDPWYRKALRTVGLGNVLG